MNRSFDLCQDSGTGTKFFPPGIEAMTGTFEEVPCQGNWVGGESEALWNGACMANDTTALWPGKGCLNHGTKYSFARAVMQCWLMFTLRFTPMSG